MGKMLIFKNYVTGAPLANLIESWLSGYVDISGQFIATGEPYPTGEVNTYGWACSKPITNKAGKYYTVKWAGYEGKKVRLRSFNSNTPPYGTLVDNIYVTVNSPFTVSSSALYFTINVCCSDSYPAISDATVAKCTNLTEVQNIAIN